LCHAIADTQFIVHNYSIPFHFDSFQFNFTAMHKPPKTPKHPIQIRLPGQLFESLQARAEAESRSLNAMVNLLIAQQLQSPVIGAQQHSTSVASR